MTGRCLQVLRVLQLEERFSVQQTQKSFSTCGRLDGACQKQRLIACRQSARRLASAARAGTPPEIAAKLNDADHACGCNARHAELSEEARRRTQELDAGRILRKPSAPISTTGRRLPRKPTSGSTSTTSHYSALTLRSSITLRQEGISAAMKKPAIGAASKIHQVLPPQRASRGVIGPCKIRAAAPAVSVFLRSRSRRGMAGRPRQPLQLRQRCRRPSQL